MTAVTLFLAEMGLINPVGHPKLIDRGYRSPPRRQVRPNAAP